MANTTVQGAKAIHGQNPQFLVETVIRNRIYDSSYWKEHCFALTAESIIDKAIEVKYIGGVYGNQRPTEFVCLLLKLLQIQPEKEILIEYLRADEFKYLRALAALYIRMTFRPVEVYELLEPLLKDYRKLRQRTMTGYTLTFIDEFVYALLTEERVIDLILPRLPKREILEENGELGPRKSRLLDAMEDRDESERGRSRSRSGSRSSRSRSRSWSGGRSRSGSRSRSRSSSRGRSRSRSPVVGYISRTPSRSQSRSPRRSRSVSSAGSRFISRSPSRSRSRSRSISPDRMDVDAKKD
ncbi:pre-RNA splicing factor 38A [Coprinopsis cinerea okayama7|uniref:Pre-mRNA-splicing factor 38 n=1 Tax=Coprinopsis cinerea (strain Okayama-7 / 130 / ATCC MYA-4618 / FGSC 9003) TaxID=240176 RepID=A8NG64_COPC7|nr:pre-RNA splicing factor 38A [Coprinopsis cinerea okayama7\|eukprot:XP_001833489.2 pre-RNA splicing factor 38A [Coprinopsis cinerea okayama7\